MTTGIIKDRRYMDHHMGYSHVETPQRLEVIYRMIDEKISFSLDKIEPRLATKEELALIHTTHYIDMVKSTAGKEHVQLDPDTSTSAKSWEVACLAAGGVINAVDSIMEGKIQNGFALVRPPGHHAEASRAMGFCLFNNIGIGAAHLIQKHGLKRILVMDWDLHHGNGTQHSFYESAQVLYFSTHQFPHYPGTGHWNEVGEGKGEGFTVNIPLRAGKTDGDYLRIFQQILRPIVSEYKPEFILVSAGFDIYEGDPLGGMQITKQGFAALAAELLDLTASFSQKRLLCVLEGGYDLQGLQDGVEQVLYQLAGEASKPNIDPTISSTMDQELAPAIEIQKKFWKSVDL
ncbi:MAG: histone deacetylase [Candidatus Aminicenantes bacterium]|nr:MAG: histone deacetylase [Candidatus Aminicenantes bacterium]